MKPNPLQRQGSAVVPRRHRFRRLFLELLESRLVPSTITSLSPSSVAEGSGSFTLGVTGSDLGTNATVEWNGMLLTTSAISATQLQATVPASLLTEEGTASISVVGLGSSGLHVVSNTLPFTIIDAPLSASGGLVISAGPNPFAVQATAMFTDTGGPEPLSNYSATINWGDGTSSAGSITGPTNGVFTVNGSHTYPAVGTFTVSVTVNHETAPPLVISSTVNVPVTTSGGPAITSLSGPALVEGSGDATLLVNGVNFVPGAQVQLNGTTFLTTTFNSSTQLQATLPGSLRSEETGPEHGTFPLSINVVETLNGVTVTSGLASLRIAEAPLSAMGGVTVTATAGQNFSGKVATFTDTGGPEALSDYSATIDWGDKTQSSGTISGPTSGVFTVSGSHTYGVAGTFTITVTISHENAPAVTVTSTANVAAPPLSATGGLVLYGYENQILTATVATFSGGGATLSNCSATINWGDGTTSAGTISGPDSNGIFTVTGTHVYTEEATALHGFSPFTITVTITCGSNTATVTDIANISETPLSTSGGVTITSLSAPALVEGGGAATLVVNGINFVSGATIQVNGVSLPTTFNNSSQLQAVIPAAMLTEESGPEHGGPLFVGVVETVNGVPLTSNLASLQVAEAPLSATGGVTVTATAGQSFSGKVATFTDTGGPEALSDYSATIDWGDKTTPSAGTISGPTNGVFTVSGSHTYGVAGTFTITVTISHETLPAVTVTSTATVSPAALSATGGLFLFGNADQALTATVATFSGSGATLSNCSAKIDWGDGTTASAGTITGPDSNGVFTVTGTHTYTGRSVVLHGVSPFTVTVTITCGSLTATVTDMANITADPLSAAGGVTINPVQGRNFTATVATFTDSRAAQSSMSPANYTAAIAWGDGNTSAGIVTANVDGSFGVSGSYTYQRAATYAITVSITDTTGFTANTTSTANVAEHQPVTSSGLDLTATVSVANDFTVAQFTDPDPTAHTGGYAVAINWGDGTPISAGTVTQPGGPGTPFFIDYTHVYGQVGVFTVDVRVFEEAGAVAEVSSTATVGSPAPRAPGRRGAGHVQTNSLLVANAAQATSQPLQAGTLTISSAASIVPIQTSTSPQLGSSSAGSDDLYWQLVGERLTDPGSAADQLALTLVQDPAAI